MVSNSSCLADSLASRAMASAIPTIVALRQALSCGATRYSLPLAAANFSHREHEGAGREGRGAQGGGARSWLTGQRQQAAIG